MFASNARVDALSFPAIDFCPGAKFKLALEGSFPANTDMTFRAVALGLLFVLIWSSAFTSGKFIVADAPPITFLAIRFFLSGGIGIALAFCLGERINLTRQQLFAVVVFGICQNALYLGLNFVAFQWVDASIAVVIASLLPIAVGLSGWLFLGERLAWLGIAGLALGLIGSGIVLSARLEAGADIWGILLCILGVLALTVATLTVKTLAASGNILMMVGLQMLVGAVVLAPVGFMLETWDVTWSRTMITAFIYTTFFPGLFATWIWFKLLEQVGATKAATFHFLNPFFGVVVAWVLLGEQITKPDLVGVVFIMAAILAVQMSTFLKTQA